MEDKKSTGEITGEDITSDTEIQEEIGLTSIDDYDLPTLIGDMIWNSFFPAEKGCLDKHIEIDQIFTWHEIKPSRAEVDQCVKLLLPFLSRLSTEWLMATADAKEQFITSLTRIMNRTFPKVQGDRVIQIGTVFFRYGDTTCFRRHITTLGGCDPIENVIVEAYTEGDDDEKERNVILGWADEILNTNPNLITGYNIFGFDYSFIWERAKELHCQKELGDLLSKLSHRPSFLEDKTLSSAGLGHNELKFLNTPGRIQMDLFKIIQRDHNLVSYKLDYVSGHFITGKISETQLEVMENKNDKQNPLMKVTKIITNNTMGVIRDNFITFWYPVTNGTEKYLNGQKIKVIDYGVEVEKMEEDEGEGSGEGGEGEDKATKDKVEPKKYKYILVEGHHGLTQDGGGHATWQWGLAKDDVSPSDIFRLQKGNDHDRSIIAKYCVQDCELCINLCNKLDIVSNNIGMSNVCSVPLSYIFLRGQGVKIFSLVAKQCRLEGFLIITRSKKRNRFHDQMMSHEDQFEEWMEREVFRPCQHRTKHLVEVPKYGIVKLVTDPETIPVASDDIVRIVIETLDEKKIRVGLDEEALKRFHETKYFYVDEEELQDPQVATYLQVTKRHVHLLLEVVIFQKPFNH